MEHNSLMLFFANLFFNPGSFWVTLSLRACNNILFIPAADLIK